MTKFLLIYSGGNPPQSEAEGAAVMKAWTDWFMQLGPAVVDGGNPTAHPAKAISSRGEVSEVTDQQVTGYSILQAASLDEAVGMSKSCPHRDAGGTVRVYPLMEM